MILFLRLVNNPTPHFRRWATRQPAKMRVNQKTPQKLGVFLFYLDKSLGFYFIF